jgi:hypothetical protein
MAGGICLCCGAKGVSTRARKCGKCAKNLFVCMGCTSREVNMRVPILCRPCQPKTKARRR